MKTCSCALAAMLAAGAALPSFAKTALDVPVSGVTNLSYLTEASARPWWNKAWTRRAPLLVSSMADVASRNGWVDCIVDFGEKVKPEDVRLVTREGELLPCWCGEVRGEDAPATGNGGEGAAVTGGSRSSATAYNLVFSVPLRPRENVPLLLYWGRRSGDAPAAKNGGAPTAVQPSTSNLQPSPLSPLTLCENEGEIWMGNGLVTLVIDKRCEYGNALKHFYLAGSQGGDLLTPCGTGYAWCGFQFETGRSNVVWQTCRVTADTPFKKEVTMDAPDATLVWTIYPNSPRADYAYTLKRAANAYIRIAWGPGGGAARDTFTYTGLAGTRLSFRAALDEITDCEGLPTRDHLEKWMKEGWYAIHDYETRDTVGMIYDRAAIRSIHYASAHHDGGERLQLQFEHDRPLSGRGALVGTLGGADIVAAEYARLSAPPQVFLGTAESYREIPLVLPDYEHDFMGEYVTGMNPGHWRHAWPGKSPDWAENLARYLLHYGANSGRIGGYGWAQLDLPKDLFDRCRKLIETDPNVQNHVRRVPIAPWTPETYSGKNLKEISRAFHAHGLGMGLWTGMTAGILGGSEHLILETPLYRQLALDLEPRYAASGADIVYDCFCCLEGPWMPSKLRKERGGDYWRWEKPEDFFKAQDDFIGWVRDFYRNAKSLYPKKPVFVFSAEGGSLGRELPLADMIGSFDAEYCELCPGNIASAPNVKHSVKRLRSHFDNTSHTAYHHFYYYTRDHAWRVSQLEVPFAFGVNGFSHEVMMHDTIDDELDEITGDFFRFAQDTGLGAKVSKMTPVKYLAVLRDSRLFRQDVLDKANNKSEDRLASFAKIRHLNYDIVANPFFKAESLKRYKVVYVPENRVFDETQAKELLKYVEAGGNAIVEGATVGDRGEDAPATKSGAVAGASSPRDGKSKQSALQLQLKTLAPDALTSYGKGGIFWAKTPLTDALMKGDARPVVELVKKLGGEPPYAVAHETLPMDSLLQSSEKGMFLAIYNEKKSQGKGVVVLKKQSSTVQPSTSNLQPALFVLDVRTGVRLPLTNNTFAVSVGPQQCGFYLIGDDAFTAVPKVRPCPNVGAAAQSVRPQGTPPPAFDAEKAKSFEELRAVEVIGFDVGFLGYTSGERLARPDRIEHLAISTTRFFPDEAAAKAKFNLKDLDAWKKVNAGLYNPFDDESFAKALKRAKVLYVRGDDAAALPFARCPDAVKAFLARGGGIVFDCLKANDTITAFLKEVGVEEPMSAGRYVKSCGSKSVKAPGQDHPIAADAERKDFNREGFGRYHLTGGGWKGWSDKQIAPVRAFEDPEHVATVISQENVCGKGKVVFLRNWNAWWSYTSSMCDGLLAMNILSWIYNHDVRAYEKELQIKNGGPGEVRP